MKKAVLVTLLYPLALMVALAAPVPFATWTATELTLNNGVVQRIIQLPAAEGSFLTTSYKPVAGKFRYFRETSPDFQFEINDSVYAGSGGWRLVMIQKLTDANQGDGAAVTLDNIARAAHLSTSFFSRKFRQDTGYAPIAYFNHLRIQKACQLLHFSDLRINEVASQLGMDDPFYFSRLFRKQMGVSPVEYRKKEGLQRQAR